MKFVLEEIVVEKSIFLLKTTKYSNFSIKV